MTKAIKKYVSEHYALCNFDFPLQTVPSQLLAIPSKTEYFIFDFGLLILVSVDNYIIILIINSL